MDAAHLSQLFIVVAIAAGMAWFALSASGQAGDGIAALFVPPNRALGWPRGVQESDEPWAWRSPPPDLMRMLIAERASSVDPISMIDLDSTIVVGRGGVFVVPVARVRPSRTSWREVSGPP